MMKLFLVLIGLRAFGPTALIPFSLNRCNISSCAFLPSAPPSEKPPEMMVTPLTLLATQSLTIPSTLLAGTQITTRSISPAMLLTSGYAFNPKISSVFGFTGYTFPENFNFTRFDTR